MLSIVFVVLTLVFFGFVVVERFWAGVRCFGTASFFDDCGCRAGGLEAFNVVFVGGNVVDFDDVTAPDRIGTDRDDGAG